jgi:PilZ domain
MHEHRRFQRVRPTGMMAKTGTIFVDMKSPPTACTIVDVSAAGACIEVQGSGAIPQRFIFNYGGVKKTGHVVWQKGRRVGVAF